MYFRFINTFGILFLFPKGAYVKIRSKKRYDFLRLV